jgi:tRNA A37 threonylcarbamoyladenosine dehydratase
MHEHIYRGREAMKTLKRTVVAICGTGAVGLNPAFNLARQGFHSLVLIDRDRVDLRNLSTQV